MKEDGELRQRVMRVEQEMHRWRYVAVLAGTALSVVALTGQAVPRTAVQLVEREARALVDTLGL